MAHGLGRVGDDDQALGALGYELRTAAPRRHPLISCRCGSISSAPSIAGGSIGRRPPARSLPRRRQGIQVIKSGSLNWQVRCQLGAAARSGDAAEPVVLLASTLGFRFRSQPWVRAAMARMAYAAVSPVPKPTTIPDCNERGFGLSRSATGLLLSFFSCSRHREVYPSVPVCRIL